MSETSHELDFWDSILETKGGQWPGDFQNRLDPDSQVADFMRGKLFANAHVLDVGAGPLTTFGKRCGEDRIIVTAVDPLAEGYNRLLEKHGIVPPVRTILGFGEGLYEQFGADRFDLVNAQNSVDHSQYPMTVILEMIAVTKPGGWVTLLHHRNEGEKQKYQGMHGWNFDTSGDDLVLWNKGQFYNVTHKVKHVADCTARIMDGNLVFAEIRKRKGGELK
jgi:SAM-dependent methyltransferase